MELLPEIWTECSRDMRSGARPQLVLGFNDSHQRPPPSLAVVTGMNLDVRSLCTQIRSTLRSIVLITVSIRPDSTCLARLRVKPFGDGTAHATAARVQSDPLRRPPSLVRLRRLAPRRVLHVASFFQTNSFRAHSFGHLGKIRVFEIHAEGHDAGLLLPDADEVERHYYRDNVQHTGLALQLCPPAGTTQLDMGMKLELLAKDRRLHAGWVAYELQRQLQLAKAVLKDTEVRSIVVVIHLEHIQSLPMGFPGPSGQWMEDHTYVGPHEPISRVIKLSEIHDHDGDKRNTVMPAVVDIMDEISRIYGQSKARNLWDENGRLLYVRGLENHR
jgi:hypothetical protein